MTTAKPRVAHDVAPNPDPEIMQRLGAGELGALGELYDRYQHPVRRYLARATSGAEDVDDLVHGTFLTAAKSAVRYDGSASCRPWLIGIATRLLRRRRSLLRDPLRSGCGHASPRGRRVERGDRTRL